MNNISFQSKIRYINKNEFSKLTSTYSRKTFVDYPWTVKESILDKQAYTKDIFDCTVCGITDGLKVLMLHICPTRGENANFYKIIDFIKKKIDLKNPDLQGFLLGSKNLPSLGPKSAEIFDNFENFFEKHNIPYSKIRGGLHENNVAYSSVNDEWLVSHEMLDNPNIKEHFKTPEKFLEKFYDEFKICEQDELTW